MRRRLFGQNFNENFEFENIVKAIYQLTASITGTAIGPTAAPLINGAAHGEILKEMKAAEERKREAEQRDAKRKLGELKRVEAGGGEEPLQQFPIPWALTILIVWIAFR